MRLVLEAERMLEWGGLHILPHLSRGRDQAEKEGQDCCFAWDHRQREARAELLKSFDKPRRTNSRDFCDGRLLKCSTPWQQTPSVGLFEVRRGDSSPVHGS
mmetsp:Transcript_124421/g.398470  ORF Transcript_124421/g.398470 Transcript_124421/m.398470 type:complete len:101 (-) Transcript_124421:8-310(-)